MRRQLVHYAGAAVLVRGADEGARVALVLLALERTRSAALGGLLVAALLVPHVVAAGVVGAVADRSRRPLRLVAAASAGFGAPLPVAPLALGPVPTPVVLRVLLPGGCFGPAPLGALSSRLSALGAPPGGAAGGRRRGPGAGGRAVRQAGGPGRADGGAARLRRRRDDLRRGRDARPRRGRSRGGPRVGRAGDAGARRERAPGRGGRGRT